LNYNDYKGVENYIFNAKNIVLSTHTSPDGDTLGSALGLYHFLKSKGISTQLVCPDTAPDFLSWMPAYEEFIIFKNDSDKFQETIKNADLIVHIDYNAFHRTGDDVANIFENHCTAKHVLIDHHPQPMKGFEAYVSDTSACSTAQLVYQFTQSVDAGLILSSESATCLYVGLITDTGSFNYGMVDEKPYLIGAALVKAGIDDKKIHELVYSNNTLNRLKLLGYALSEKLVINEEEHWAYISLTREELDKYNYEAGDTEGIVNYALSVNGVVAAVLLTQKDDKIRLSFRSKSQVTINGIARDHFNGGGHLNAAGGNSYAGMDETIFTLKQRMHEFKNELNKVG